MKLTPAGEILFHQLGGVLQQMRDAESRIAELTGALGGEIVVSGAESALPALITEFQKMHPGVGFRALICSSDDVLQSLIAFRSHIGVAYSMASHPSIDVIKKFKAPIGLLVSKSHPFATRSFVPLREAVSAKVVIPDVDFGIRQSLDLTLNAVGLRLLPVVSSNNFWLLRTLVASGDYVTFASALTARSEINAGQLVAVPLSDAMDFTGSIIIAKRNGRTLHSAAEKFIEMICEFYGKELAG